MFTKLCVTLLLATLLPLEPALPQDDSTTVTVEFGPAARIEGSWSFERSSGSEQRCRVWLDDRLARDEDLDYREVVQWKVGPSVESDGPGWDIEYLRDSRSPSMERLVATITLDADGQLDFSNWTPPENLVRDFRHLHEAPPVALAVSGRRFQKGDRLEVPAPVLGELLLSRAAVVVTSEIVLVEEIRVDDQPAARFSLKARTRAKLEKGGTETTVDLEGSLVLRLSDGAPLSVDVKGPTRSQREWESELGARLRLAIEGTSTHEARWTYGD